MEKDDREILERMAKAQEEIAVSVKKPENKIDRVFQYGSGIVAILGIIAIIDIIVRWIGG